MKSKWRMSSRPYAFNIRITEARLVRWISGMVNLGNSFYGESNKACVPRRCTQYTDGNNDRHGYDLHDLHADSQQPIEEGNTMHT